MVRVGAIDSPPKTPVILGFECAGEIEAVAEGVDNFKVSGDGLSRRDCMNASGIGAVSEWVSNESLGYRSATEWWRSPSTVRGPSWSPCRPSTCTASPTP